MPRSQHGHPVQLNRPSIFFDRAASPENKIRIDALLRNKGFLAWHDTLPADEAQDLADQGAPAESPDIVVRTVRGRNHFKSAASIVTKNGNFAVASHCSLPQHDLQSPGQNLDQRGGTEHEKHQLGAQSNRRAIRSAANQKQPEASHS